MQPATARPSSLAAAAARSAADREALRSAFARMKAAHHSRPMPSHEQRIARLDKLLGIIREYRNEIAEAISDDFGHRSSHETQLAEILTLVSGIRYLKKNLKTWMRPEPRRVMLAMQPASARVHPQPLGVVGVLAPWNYPFQLAIAPVATALAAGNCVMLKPSEYTPRTALLLRRVIRDAFEPEVVTVVIGDADLAAEFSRLPFDHLLFTGSARVGRAVMRAAAENLTRVTLELGGKSPAIVHESFSRRRAAARIAAGKWFNAGQTCIAPDYALVPRAQVDAMAAQIGKHAGKLYPTLEHNPDYSSIVNDEHHARIVDLIDDAVARGARKLVINPAGEQLDPADRKIAPTVLVDVDDGMRVMQEEIFGPVLPILGYDSLEQAIGYVNERPRPLTLYYFDDDRARVQQVLEQTVSGGACVNDTLVQFAVDDLPFGGVGPSGLGAYHGREGFEAFSHRKGVFYQSRYRAAGAVSPPYGARADRMIDLLTGDGRRSRRERLA
jgi:acyl-CoA reductase-like NAD-dependent aldehyde dehydrogenase